MPNAYNEQCSSDVELVNVRLVVEALLLLLLLRSTFFWSLGEILFWQLGDSRGG